MMEMVSSSGSFSAVRQRYTQEDAPGGSLMYEMHWNELSMVGYVIMKFSDFRKAVQLQKVRRNGKALIEIMITRPDMYETIGDGRLDEGLVPIVETMTLNAEVSPSWYVRDRLRNYSGRYVVVIVDLRVHWSLVGPVFLTRRKAQIHSVPTVTSPPIGGSTSDRVRKSG